MHIFSVQKISQHCKVCTFWLERRYILPNSEFKRAEFVLLLYCSTSEFLYFDIPLDSAAEFCNLYSSPHPQTLPTVLQHSPISLFLDSAFPSEPAECHHAKPRKVAASSIGCQAPDWENTTNTRWGKLSCSNLVASSPLNAVWSAAVESETSHIWTFQRV